MRSSYLEAVRRLDRDVWLIIFFRVTLGVCFIGIYSVVFNLYLLRLGYGSEFIGLVQGIVFLGMSAFSLLSGWMGKRYGSRRMLIIGSGLSILPFAAIPFSEVIPATYRSIWIASSYALLGICVGSIVVVNTPPFLMSRTNEEDRSHVFSILTGLRRISGFAGSLFAGLLPGFVAVILSISLSDPAPYRFPLMLPPFVCCIGFILVVLTRNTQVTEKAQAESEGGQKGKAPVGHSPCREKTRQVPYFSAYLPGLCPWPRDCRVNTQSVRCGGWIYWNQHRHGDRLPCLRRLYYGDRGTGMAVRHGRMQRYGMGIRHFRISIWRGAHRCSLWIPKHLRYRNGNGASLCSHFFPPKKNRENA